MANESIKLFETQKVNVYWDNELEEWYFCINDVIEILTDSVDPAEYFKKLRKRDSELDTFVRGTNCPPPHQFRSTDGKLHAQRCLNTKDTLRLIQSIPSKKAEPFKMWLAQVGHSIISSENAHNKQALEIEDTEGLVLEEKK